MSVEMQVDVSGILELEEKMQNFDQSMRLRVDQALDSEVEAMQNIAESLAPKRTGRLARSIVARRLSEWSFQLLALVPYARYVEFGTRHMLGRRFLSRALELGMRPLINHVNQAVREAIWEASTS